MKLLILLITVFISCSKSIENKTANVNIETHKDTTKTEVPFVSVVSTVLDEVTGFDGFDIQSDGTFILASGWTNSTVYKLNRNGDESILADGFGGPVFIRLFKNDIYVANFTAGNVYKVSNDGTKELVVTGIDAPAPLVFDKDGNLYIGNYGATYQGRIITKVTPSGEKSTFINDPLVYTPIGLVFDENENLYIANQVGGRVSKYSDGKLTSLAISPLGHIGHMIYLKGHLYITSGPNIYKITLDGKVTKFAGTGSPGFANGKADEASFTRANGLSTDGKDLFVGSRSGVNPNKLSIRKITVE